MSDHDEAGLMLDAYEASFKEGKRISLFAAINHCAVHGLKLPQWAARAFITGYKRIRSFDAASLDDAFGKPHPDGIHIDRAAFKKSIQLDVYVTIRHLNEKRDRTIDDVLFEEVGKKFGIGRTVCKELYSEVNKLHTKKPSRRTPRKR
ncbi:hypothetical protein [Bradyrhizobium sp. JYMT SZCCT0428]|uniref:hypothetical protein n=1 Tax=Bradyrhizobium sp. JYMT SZCCT0428 TaxID=2807673 RepID=UPI001BA9A57B|nr:hypothetical protein [Bradyrhizobium sp. JYMT SZCCT0428]MBR1149351.1 hypothetical protein [Bradyrhizobium sp. JYMT SZCCT0428]